MIEIHLAAGSIDDFVTGYASLSYLKIEKLTNN
jgi:sensor c-di-GMP phosphodiesterase-like protein